MAISPLKAVILLANKIEQFPVYLLASTRIRFVFCSKCILFSHTCYDKLSKNLEWNFYLSLDGLQCRSDRYFKRKINFQTINITTRELYAHTVSVSNIGLLRQVEMKFAN